LQDKFGLSWQIIPKRLGELLTDKGRAKADRTMKPMLQMVKIGVNALERAHAGS
jgi:predicted 3-demethylubiquinone-9 3-methyltransferase (glyoxalase superfamily)